MVALLSEHLPATIAIVLGIVSLIAAGIFALRVLRLPSGNEEMVRISGAIRVGAMAYLKRQFSVISIIAFIIFLLLGFLMKDTGWYLAIAFLVGAACSGLAAYVGMATASRANVRTAEASRHGLARGLAVAVSGGAVNGLFVVGLSLIGVSAFYLIFLSALGNAPELLHGSSALTVAPELLIGFGFGASLVSLFARVGGGIFTKAADVGADLVGKIEKDIPEDDARNPAVIADNVGDMVGDCAGMGADLFETYAVTLIAAMILGASTMTAGIGGQRAAIEYPLALGAIAIVASIAGIFAIRLGKRRSIMGALYKGLAVASVLSAVGFYVVTGLVFEGSWVPSTAYAPLFWAGIVGLIVTVLINIITEYYTGKNAPVKEIAKASETGAGTNVITGLAVGLKSTTLPVLVLVLGTFAAYHLGEIWSHGNGIYGIAIAAVAMLSTTGLIITMDTYGPITDNAGGIAEMAGLPENVRTVTDELDSVGNTTKAVTKGYAIGSAALATLVLFQAFVHAVDSSPLKNYAGNGGKDFVLELTNINVFVGLLIGAALPFLFSAWCMQAVGRAAHKVVEEVRRQFRTIPGIMERTAQPDYSTAVDIVTKSALREMILPGLMAVVAPLLVGWLFGAWGLGGLLVGAIAAGLLLALQMANGGGAWDNAKKLIEQQGHKGSDAHKAAVVGDTVGDPFKDTAGPALNALIKVMNTVALIIAASLATNLGGVLEKLFR